MTARLLVLPSLVDCEVCAGTGVMTARPVDAAVEQPPAVVPCPRCAGQGATLRQAAPERRGADV